MYGVDFHADDYAASVENSEKILSLLRAGRINSLSVITNMGCYEQCMNMLRDGWDNFPEKPLLSLHVNLIDGYWLSAGDSGRIIHHSWGQILFRSFLPGRKQLRRAYSTEIEAQIRAFMEKTADLRDGSGHPVALRIDSHVHTHMIPLVFQALVDALDNTGFRKQAGFIRCSVEPLHIILFTPHVAGTISPVNILKNLTLRILSLSIRKKLQALGITAGCVFGIAMTGEMDLKRVRLLLPKMKRYAQKKNAYLEILSHPGRSLPVELSDEYGPDDRKAFISPQRDVEYSMLMEISGSDSQSPPHINEPEEAADPS